MKQLTLKRLMKSFNKGSSQIYLAGPFFNELQIQWARYISKVLQERGYKIFAPVTFFEPGVIDPEEATKIFHRNILQMNKSTFILAQLDYPTATPVSLKLPDSGTVWEMGFAFAKNIPIIGYVWCKELAKINLMLGVCLAGYIDLNDRTVYKIFKPEGINWNLVMEWKGALL